MSVAKGYRLVHMESLQEFVERVHSASQDCASGGTATPMSTVTPSTGVTSQNKETCTYKPPVTEATTSTSGTKNEVVIGASIGVAAAVILIGCSVCWYCNWYSKRHRRQSDAKKIAELSTEEGAELGEITSPL
ncbi:uncharacterized protein LOC111341759 [Stylophora pistillata]|uniref:uncharacterized protein LOC111341759 n=1 Tax=Stylophora pistillata TaxID=50429 RepID=UPI000C04482E|nr:uncharacterized protein LOC111341759 [Stylophora pistillata]